MIHSKQLYSVVEDIFNHGRKWKTTPEDGIFRFLDRASSILLKRYFMDNQEVFAVAFLNKNDELVDELTTNEDSPMTLLNKGNPGHEEGWYLDKYQRLQTGFESPQAEERKFREVVALLPLLYAKVRNETLDVEAVRVRLS